MQVRTKAEKLMPRRVASSFGGVAQRIWDAQGHGDLVAVHQEVPDLGFVGIALDEFLCSCQASALPSLEMQYKCVY